MKKLEYNLYLETDDVRIAHHIARVVNQKGQPAVTARGTEQDGKISVQIIIYDWRKFSLIKALETVQTNAKQFNVNISGGILGSVPLEAMLDVIQKALVLTHVPVIDVATGTENPK